MSTTSAAANSTPLRIFVHEVGLQTVRVVEAGREQILQDVVGHDAQSGAQIWIEGRDTAVELSDRTTVGELGDNCHLFHGRCYRVIVGVRYNGDTISKEFRPTKKIARVLEWAINDSEFAITDPQSGDYSVKLSSSETYPDDDDFVGSFVGDDCEVFLDLLPSDKFQGAV